MRQGNTEQQSAITIMAAVFVIFTTGINILYCWDLEIVLFHKLDRFFRSAYNISYPLSYAVVTISVLFFKEQNLTSDRRKVFAFAAITLLSSLGSYYFNHTKVFLFFYILSIVFTVITAASVSLRFRFSDGFKEEYQERKDILKGDRYTKDQILNKLKLKAQFFFLIIKDITGKKTFVTVDNFFTSCFVSGGAGSGKSESVIIPLFTQMAYKGFTGLIYDFKNFDLSEVAHYIYELANKRGILPNGLKFSAVNFTDMSRTVRINPFSPRYISSPVQLDAMAKTFFSNLDADFFKKSDFFSKTALLVFKGVFFALKELDAKRLQRHLSNGQDQETFQEYCTVPHIISIINSPLADADTLSNLIKSSAMGSMIAASFLSGKDAKNQTAGVLSSINTELGKCIDKNIFWVLSKDELRLDLNNPQNPTVLCLVNNPTLRAALSPFTALIIKTVLSSVNKRDRLPFSAIIDEYPTTIVPDIQEFPETARSNKCSVTLAIQNIASLNEKQTENATKSVLGTIANQFYFGSKEIGTAEQVSKMAGKIKVKRQSVGSSRSSGMKSGDSENYAVQEEDLIPTNEISAFSPGEGFANTSSQTKKYPFYMGKFSTLKDYLNILGMQPNKEELQGLKPKNGDYDYRKPIPKFKKVNSEDVDANFNNIIASAEEILKDFAQKQNVEQREEQFYDLDEF